MGNLNTSAAINIVDHADNVIGSTNRNRLPIEPSNFRVVHLFAFNSSGSLLMQHIAPGHRSSGRWGSSVAGYVLEGESYAEACRRKTNNELNLADIEIIEVGKTSMTDLGATKFITLYTATIDDLPEFDAAQISEMGFYSPGEVYERLRREPAAFTPTLRHLISAFPLAELR